MDRFNDGMFVQSYTYDVFSKSVTEYDKYRRSFLEITFLLYGRTLIKKRTA